MKLIFPEKILDQHLIALGKTGAGKSSALRHIVEWLLTHKKRVCIIDPKGDWWGLKWSADGRSEGFPVVAFGDFKGRRKGDIPINDRAGRQVAELVASGNRPCVIGFAGWTITAMTEFWIHFAEGIFSQNQGELYIIGDEFHNFAPKGSLKGKEGRGTMSLHWSNRLLSEGRGIGIVCLLASQRPAKVHNDTLTSCETLVAMRVTHAADRRAYEDWIDGCGDEARGHEVVDSSASMPRGEAFVWSPEINYGPERIKFPMFQTFDSFAPPQLQKAVVENNWDNVDLDAVKAKLATVIEEAKANDPAELKRKLRETEQKLRQAEQKVPETKQLPVFDAGDRALLHKAQVAFESLEDGIEKMMSGPMDEVRNIYRELNALSGRVAALADQPKQAVIRSHRSVGPVGQLSDLKKIDRTRSAVMVNGDFSPPGAKPSVCQEILNAIAELNILGVDQPAREMVALMAGYTNLTSTGYAKAVSHLRTEGLVDYPNADTVILTADGAVRAKAPAKPQTSEEIQNRICRAIGGKARYPSLGLSDLLITRTARQW